MITNNSDWKKSILAPTSTIKDAASNLTESALRIVLVAGKDQKLLGTVSDGDIRRGLLRGLTLGSDISEVMQKTPLVVPSGISGALIKDLMIANKVQQIPEVDQDNRILCLHTWDKYLIRKKIPNKMVIMAGGKGARLRPYTENCPKPMLLVGGKPILQHIIERARDEGFDEFLLSVHYLSHIIEEYFGDGVKFGVSIKYVYEESPLGTAGALSLIKQHIAEPFIVTNGDVITDIRYSDLLEFHNRQESIATMAVRIHEWQHPFGVVQMKGLDIVGFEEKPIVRSHINAGVYALSPAVLLELTYAEPCDMPQLFERLHVKAYKTAAYPMHEPWLDVGRHDDLIAANEKHLQE